MSKELDLAARERAMDKIRKLLALAADNCNEHEAAVAAGQAEKMMRYYQIDSSEITLSEIEQDDSFERGLEDVSFEGIEGHKSKQAPTWVGVIAIGCGKAFTCKVDLVMTPQGVKVRFSGYAMDVMLAKWVYRFLCETVYRISKREMSGLGMSAAKSFRAGAANELQMRLYNIKDQRDMDNKINKDLAGNNMGLVIYGRKQERVNEMFGKQDTKNATGSVGDRSAYNAGRNAASQINIPTNNPLGSPSEKRRLSWNWKHTTI